MADKKKVLVVGGCGFLGRHIVEQFLEGNYNVELAVFDLFITNFNDSVTFIKGDLNDLDQVKNACKGVHTVIHTASPTHGKSVADFEKVNVYGTRTLLQACVDSGVQQLIFTSSASVVFDGSDLKGVDETTPYCKKFIDAYNETKATAEKEVLEWNGKSGLKTCALRPSGIFGPRDRQAWPGFIEAAKAGKSKVTLGDGTNLMDWTYVVNIAYAHILAFEKLQEPNSKVAGQAFFVTNGEPIPFWDMATFVWKNLDYPTPKFSIPKWLILTLCFITDLFVKLLSPVVEIHPTLTYFRVVNATAHRYFNINKAKQLLGYQPKVSVREGMNITLKHFESFRNPNSPNAKKLN